MKKIFFSAFVLILLFGMISCSVNSPSSEPSQELIESLEAQISMLEKQQAQYVSEHNQLSESIAAALDSISTDGTSPSDTETNAIGFQYTVEAQRAIITGYAGDEVDLVIPSSIDGYEVFAIADGAFSDMKIRSVIISDGVESIGWFAFDGCVRLSAVTLPSSINSIGYSAFGGNTSDLTIYCHNGSFALRFAQSFGISYAVI